MVSTRPSPNPPQGRVAYPSAATYIPGDAGTSPGYITDPSPSTSARGGGPLSLAPPGLFQVRSSGSASSGGGERRQNTQGLRAWWSNFQNRQSSSQSNSQNGRRPRAGTYLPPTQGERNVFGASLERAIQVAAAEISTGGPENQLYVYGYIPLVVAKTGLRLKNTALEIEGVFRVSGSEKRTKELQEIFDTPPRFGKDIEWDQAPYNQYTSHDIATIFRRFLTLMPSPLIPPEYYHSFRSVLPDAGAASTDGPVLSVDEAVEKFRALVKSMPLVNQHLLLYVLDLLNMFAKRSEKNKMDASNLAVVFQPGILSNSEGDIISTERMKSTAVLTFLIEHQEGFLNGTMFPRKKGRKHGSRSKSAVKPAEGPTSPTEEAENAVAGPSTVEEVNQTAGPSSGELAAPTASFSQYRDPGESASSPDVTSRGTSPLQPSSPLSPLSRPSSPPAPVDTSEWVDADCIVPSDSDDEPNTTGYRMYETCPRPTSPTSPSLSARSTAAIPSIEASLLPAPPRPSSANSKTSRTSPIPGSSSMPSGARSPRSPRPPPVDEMFEPSDSDDEAPEGGYVMLTNSASSRRASLPARQRGPGLLLGRSRTLRSRREEKAAQGEAAAAAASVGISTGSGSAGGSGGATGLARRSTLPTKSASHFAGRFRRVVQET